jgi:hypothetical protein
MKTTLALVFAFCGAFSLAADDLKPVLSVHRSAGGYEFTWPSSLKDSSGNIIRPYFELQQSSDLQNWRAVGERLRANAPDELLSHSVASDNPHAFYRLLTSFPRNNLTLATTGAEVFGYAAQFQQSLAAIGQITPADFVARTTMPWDPATAAYWEQFNADPAQLNQGKQYGDPGYRTFDFRFNPSEVQALKANGFVVSERLGSLSFADVYYNVWHNDLPVFVSTDAILQAWHRTYDAMLEETEETYLFNGFDTLLSEMAARLPGAWAQAGSGVLKDSILDADYFLAVARSLLAGTYVPTVIGDSAQNALIQEALANISALQLKQVTLFGQCRGVDFSQFQVRGHYTHTERLGRYFRAIMWLGRTDFMVAGGPVERCPGVQAMATPREVGAAIVLWSLFNEAGQLPAWLQMDRIIQSFVGWTDSLTFPQLGGILAAAGIRSLADVPNLATLQKLQSDILTGNLGVQNIRSDYFISPLGPEQVQLPRSFLMFGQKFVPDSWALAQAVYDSILWIENGQTNKIQRRVPSALDAAFAVLGNDQIVPELVARMTDTLAPQSILHAKKWRDGLPYQHNLAAVREVMDQQSAEGWNSNIYMGWLASLRELSKPTTDANYPAAMRTRAWAMKTLNTQLASWTHLRHDTVLYAKQSYTSSDACFFPAGYVEPRASFWAGLRDTARRAADLISNFTPSGSYTFVAIELKPDQQTGISRYVPVTNTVTLASIQQKQIDHLQRFADTLETLRRLSEKELAQECFNTEDEQFIHDLIQQNGVLPWGSGGVRKYDGWYARLFYRATHFATFGFQAETTFQENYGVNAADQLVADVHTDIPDPVLIPPDPGSVLHEGIGAVNLLLVAVDNGPERFICAGPVLSHYEFEVIGEPRRLTDAEWSVPGHPWQGNGILNNSFPPDLSPDQVQGVAPPEWTRIYLVPAAR